MSWFLDMKSRYAPGMTPKAFSDLLNDIETKIFQKYPEYLGLSENEQNLKVEEAVRREIQ